MGEKGKAWFRVLDVMKVVSAMETNKELPSVGGLVMQGPLEDVPAPWKPPKD